MTPLLRPENNDGFDADKAAQELNAYKRNWRFPLIIGTAVAVIGLTAIFEPRLIWFWWPADEERTKEIKPAGDASSVMAFVHPEPEPVIQKEIQQVHVPVMVDKPRLLEVAAPPAPEPEPEIEIEPVRLAGGIGYTPQGEQQTPYMVDGIRPLEAWGCAIRPGLNVIKATFNDDVRWDYGGPISAEVSEDVLSPEAFARGLRIPLIPQGATLVGIADSTKLDRGMDLAAGPLWTEALFVDTTGMPRTINLFDAQGAGASGINAIGGDVDPRWWPIIGAATLFTVLDVIGSININLGDSDDLTSVRIGGDSAASIGREVVASMLDWKPRILTRKGTAIVIKPLKTIKVCSSLPPEVRAAAAMDRRS